MNHDREHIKLLSIFHYVVAVFVALFALIPVLHLILGIAFVSGAFPTKGDEFPAELLGWFFIVFSSFWILCGLAFAVCLALAGRYLSQFKHHTYCLVMAAIACAFAPFGTILGVFTIVMLMKDSVRAMFGVRTQSGSVP